MKIFGKSFAKRLIALGALMLCAYSFPARADEYQKFIQITCAPTLNYFSLHTIAIDNTQIGGLGPDDQMLSPEALLKAPYTCNLPAAPLAHFPAYSLTAKIVDYASGHGDGRGCLLPSFSISLELNGSEIHKFPAYGG